jgi:hypothetical protein
MQQQLRGTAPLQPPRGPPKAYSPLFLASIKNSGYKVQTLSQYLKRPAPLDAPAIDFPKIDKDMVKTGFFDSASRLMAASTNKRLPSLPDSSRR